MNCGGRGRVVGLGRRQQGVVGFEGFVGFGSRAQEGHLISGIRGRGFAREGKRKGIQARKLGLANISEQARERA